MPDYYGNNLDALNDMFDSWINYPLKITILNDKLLKKGITEEYFNLFIKLFKEYEKIQDGFAIEFIS